MSPYTIGGFRDGLATGVGLGAAVFPYGLAFGAVATQLALDPVTATAMSAMVHSGAAQFAALQIWSVPVALLPLLFATFAMNARYLLYGALLRPHLDGHAAWRVYPALFLMGDANWAIMMRHAREARLDGAFALGSGLMMYAAWVSGTGLGALFGQGDWLRAVPMEALLPLYFVTILVGLWRGRADAPPVAAAMAGSVLALWLLGPQWSLVAGGLAGALTGLAADRGRGRHDP